MNVGPGQVIRVWLRKKAVAGRVLPVVAFGCRRSNRWEPSNVERGLLLDSLQSRLLAQQVVKTLQIFSFISKIFKGRLHREAEAGELAELIGEIFQLLISTRVASFSHNLSSEHQPI